MYVFILFKYFFGRKLWIWLFNKKNKLLKGGGLNVVVLFFIIENVFLKY